MPMQIEWPDELTDDLSEILGRPNFLCGHIAHVFRADGHNIPTKAEAEQAFVIHRWIGLWAKHGSEWRQAAGADLNAALERVKERRGG